MVRIVESTELLKGLTSFRTEIEDKAGTHQSLQEVFERYRDLLKESAESHQPSEEQAEGAGQRLDG
jgi:hypothetical protein